MKGVSTLVASSAALLAGISTVDAFGWRWGSSPAKSLVEADPMKGAIDLVCETKYPLDTEEEQFIQVTQSFWTNLEAALGVDDVYTDSAAQQLLSAKKRLHEVLKLTEICEKNYVIRKFENQVKEALETIKTKTVRVGVSCTDRLVKELELESVDDEDTVELNKIYLSSAISDSSKIVSDINSLHELATDSVNVIGGRNVNQVLEDWVDEKLLILKGYEEILGEPKDQDAENLCEGISKLKSALNSTLVFASMMKDLEAAASVAIENETKAAYLPQEVELVGSEQGLMSDDQRIEAPKAKRGFFSLWGNKPNIDELITSLNNVKGTERQLERIIRAYNEEFTLLIDALNQAEQRLVKHLDPESLLQYVEALRVIKMKVAAIHSSLSLCVDNNVEEVDMAFDAFVERVVEDLNRCRLAAALQGLYYAANTNKASINSEQLKMLLALSGLVSDSVDLSLSLPSNYLEPLRSLQAKVLLQSKPEGDSSANDIETLLRLTRKVSFFLHFVSDETDLVSSAQDPFTNIFPPVATVSLDPSEIVELMYSDPNGPDSKFFYERYVNQFHKQSHGLLRALKDASTLQEEIQQLQLLKDLCMTALNVLQIPENETVESIKAFYLQVTLLLSRIKRKALRRVEDYLSKNLTIDLPRRDDYETIAAFASALYNSVPNAEVLSIQIDSLVTVADLSDLASFEADDKAKLQLENTHKMLLGRIQFLAQFYPGLDEIESHMPQNATLQKKCQDTASRLSRLEEMLVSLMHRYKDAMTRLKVPVPDTDVGIQPEVRLDDEFTGEFKSGNILLSIFGKDDTTIHQLIRDSISTNKLDKILPAYEKLFSGRLKKLPTVISQESASKYMHELVGIKKEVQNVYVSLDRGMGDDLEKDVHEKLMNIKKSVMWDFNYCKLLAAVKAIEYATKHGLYIPKVPKQSGDEDYAAFLARLEDSLPNLSTLARHLTRLAAIADEVQDMALSDDFDDWLQVIRERIEHYRQVLGEWKATVQNLNMSNTVLRLEWKLYQLQQIVRISSHIAASLVCDPDRGYSGNKVFAQLIHVPSYDLPSFEDALEQICSEIPRESATRVFELVVHGLGAYQDYKIDTLIDGSAEEKMELFKRLRDDDVNLQERLEKVEACQVLNTPLSEFKTSLQSQLEKRRSAVFDKLVAHWSIDPKQVLGVVPKVEGSFTHVLNHLDEQITKAKQYADRASFLLDLAELATQTSLITDENKALYITARQHINVLLGSHADYSTSLDQLKEKHSKNWVFDKFSESKWTPVVAKLSSFHEIMERCSQVMTEQSKFVGASDYSQDLNMVVQEPTVNADIGTLDSGSETIESNTNDSQVTVKQEPAEETITPGSEESELVGRGSESNPVISPVVEQESEPTKEESSPTDIVHVTTIAQESIIDSPQVVQEPTVNAGIGTPDLGSETIESGTQIAQESVDLSKVEQTLESTAVNDLVQQSPVSPMGRSDVESANLSESEEEDVEETTIPGSEGSELNSVVPFVFEQTPESPVVENSVQQYSVSDVGPDSQSEFENEHIEGTANGVSEGSEPATQESESNPVIPPVVEQESESPAVDGSVQQSPVSPMGMGDVESANLSEFEEKHVEDKASPVSKESELFGQDFVVEQEPEPTKEESSSTDIASVTTIAQGVIDSSQVFQKPTVNADTGTHYLGSETIESRTNASQVNVASSHNFEQDPAEGTTIPGSKEFELVGRGSGSNPVIHPVLEQTQELTVEESSSTNVAVVTTSAQEGVDKESESPVVGDLAQQYSVPSVSDVGSDNQSEFEKKPVEETANLKSEGSKSATQEPELDTASPSVFKQTPKSTVMGDVSQQNTIPVTNDLKAIPVENKPEPVMGNLSSKTNKPVIAIAQENLDSSSAKVHKPAVQNWLVAEPSSYYTGTPKLTPAGNMEKPGNLVKHSVPMPEPLKRALGSPPASRQENSVTPTILTSNDEWPPQSSSFPYNPPTMTGLNSGFKDAAVSEGTSATALPDNSKYSLLLIVTGIGAFFILVGVGIYAFLV